MSAHKKQGASDAELLTVQSRKGQRSFISHTGPAEKPLDFWPSTKRLLATLRPERIRLTAVIACAALSVALMVAGPKVLAGATNAIFEGVISKNLPAGISQQEIVDGLRAHGQGGQADMLSAMSLTPGVGVDFGKVGDILLIVLVLYVLGSLISWLQGRILTTVVQRAVYRMREQIQGKLNRLPLSYFDHQKRGEVLSRATNDVDNVAQSLQQTLSQLLSGLLTIMGVLVMMFIISPLLSVIALIVIPLSVVLTAAIAKRSQRQFIGQWRYTGELNSHIEESFTGHALMRVYGHIPTAQAEFDVKNAELYKHSFKAQFISGLIMPGMIFLGNLSYVLVAVVGGLRVASGAISLGDVQAFIQYSRQFTQPLGQVASMANVVQSGIASAERVFELLDAGEQTADVHDAAKPAATCGRVDFQDVCFSYSPDSPLIENLSLTVQPGQTVAIVGPTGAGKTTLVNLLLRFYELDSGRILLDGTDIATMRRFDLRDRIGMVLQDTWLFGGTIAENIAYGQPGCTPEQVVAAAEATHVDAFIRALPNGYDTVIDDEGGGISAGEMQLITIARAFVSQPSLLILDEATSSVDTRTELLVQRAMSALRSERTSFIIAHRLSTITGADLILVMEHGSIVEQGRHEQLIAAQGAYYRLYQSQFTSAVVTDPQPSGDQLVPAQSDPVGP